MEIVSTVSMININATMIVELISFLIFLFLINRIMFRPLRHVMHQRDEKIDSLGQDIKDSKTTLTELDNQLEERKKAAVQEATDHKIEIENEGSDQANEILAQSRKEIDAIREENETFVNNQIADARKALQDEANQLAVRMMEKILDRRLARE